MDPFTSRNKNGDRNGELDLSIVVPVYNERESIEPLLQAVRAGVPAELRYEVLIVDDGSEDGTPQIALREAERDPRIRVLRLARNHGQTAAMQAGFDHARGSVVVSMDGDLQNDPADIPKLLSKLAEGYDLVSGYRVRRQDALIRRKVPSWVANRIIRALTGVPIRDNGCSLKAYRRELLDRVHLYAEQHRFIPAVAAAAGGARIAEVPVRHHARQFGRSKYGLSRIWKVLMDLFTITMIRSFRDQPLVLFGLAGIGALLAGVLSAIAAIIAMVFFVPAKAGALVLPTFAILWFGLGGFLFMVGLLGEVAVTGYRKHEAVQPPLLREFHA